MSGHDVSTEKRDDAGRWTEGGVKTRPQTKPHQELQIKSISSNGSKDEVRMFDRTIDNMPEHAAQCIDANLQSVSFVNGDKQAMRDAYNRLVGSREILPNENPPLGAYNPEKKQILVRGGERDTESMEMCSGTLQHELGHALDAGLKEHLKETKQKLKVEGEWSGDLYGSQYAKPKVFSELHAWVKAWREEITNQKQISDYAGTTAKEGFAEFHRLVCHVRDHGGSMDEVETSFPKCCGVWKELGIL